MHILSATERLWLDAVARRGAHALDAGDREQTLNSLKVRGFVEDVDAGAGEVRLVRITDKGVHALEAQGAAPTWRDDCNRLIASIFAQRKQTLRVLDVGGGRKCSYWLPANRHLTVCDADAAALCAHEAADVKILTDIEKLDLSGRQFDLIVFWNVLEHIKAPMQALRRTLRWLAPGGAVLIRGPILSSLQGLITKYTPHMLHVAYYRYVLGEADAGKPGRHPYRTRHAPDADDRTIACALHEQGLTIVGQRQFIGPHVQFLQTRSRYAYALFRKISDVMGALTDFNAGGEKSDFFILAQRPA